MMKNDNLPFQKEGTVYALHIQTSSWRDSSLIATLRLPSCVLYYIYPYEYSIYIGAGETNEASRKKWRKVVVVVVVEEEEQEVVVGEEKRRRVIYYTRGHWAVYMYCMYKRTGHMATAEWCAWKKRGERNPGR